MSKVDEILQDKDNRIEYLDTERDFLLQQIDERDNKLNKIKKELRNIHMDDISRKILLEILNK